MRQRFRRWMTAVRAGLGRRMAAVALALAVPAAHVVRALPGVIGLLLLSAGAWMAYPPAGFIVPGALLLADKIATERHKGTSGGGGR